MNTDPWSMFDCCASPAESGTVRELSPSPRRGIAIERCRCGAQWLHAWAEIRVGDWSQADDGEVDLDNYVRLTDEEAANLPAAPTASQLEFLARRPSVSRAGYNVTRVDGWSVP